MSLRELIKDVYDYYTTNITIDKTGDYKYNVIKAIMIFLNYEYGVNILHKKYRFVSTYKNVIYTFKINLEETMFFERMEEPLNLDSGTEYERYKLNNQKLIVYFEKLKNKVWNKYNLYKHLYDDF